MTVGELRAIIEGMPDNAPLLMPGSDHSYSPASVSSGSARFKKRQGWTEDHGEDATPTEQYGEARLVLIVEANG